jgi:hypothetical protein
LTLSKRQAQMAIGKASKSCSFRCDEYSSRIADLESRLTLSKRQAQMAIGKASKSCCFMK